MDVIGYELEEARRLLEAAGFVVRVVETAPPRKVTLRGPLRVVRQRQSGEREGGGREMQLVVCREGYEDLRPARERR